MIAHDESLKSNDFTVQENYLINTTIINGISKVQDEKVGENMYVSSNTMDLLLKLIKENDNSMN